MLARLERKGEEKSVSQEKYSFFPPSAGIHLQRARKRDLTFDQCSFVDQRRTAAKLRVCREHRDRLYRANALADTAPDP